MMFLLGNLEQTRYNPKLIVRFVSEIDVFYNESATTKPSILEGHIMLKPHSS